MNELYANNVTTFPINTSPMINSVFTPTYYQPAVCHYIDSKSVTQQLLYNQRVAYTATCLKLAERESISCEEREKYLQEARENMDRTEEICSKDNKATEKQMKKERNLAAAEMAIKGVATFAGLFLYAKEARDNYDNYFNI